MLADNETLAISEELLEKLERNLRLRISWSNPPVERFELLNRAFSEPVDPALGFTPPPAAINDFVANWIIEDC